MDLDLECVASFLILVQEGHYGRAATRLSLSRSALTKRIQRLERQVGVALLLRNAAGVAGPTPAGTRFAAEAVPLLAAAHAARAAALAERPVQDIRLGVHGRIGDFPGRRQPAVRFGGRGVGCRISRTAIGGPHAAGGGGADGRGTNRSRTGRRRPGLPRNAGPNVPALHPEPGQAAVVVTGSWAASAKEPGLRGLRLTDLPPLAVYAAHRHTDRRGAVRSLVELLPQVAADTVPTRAHTGQLSAAAVG